MEMEETRAADRGRATRSASGRDRASILVVMICPAKTRLGSTVESDRGNENASVVEAWSWNEGGRSAGQVRRSRFNLSRASLPSSPRRQKKKKGCDPLPSRGLSSCPYRSPNLTPFRLSCCNRCFSRGTLEPASRARCCPFCASGEAVKAAPIKQRRRTLTKD